MKIHSSFVSWVICISQVSRSCLCISKFTSLARNKIISCRKIPKEPEEPEKAHRRQFKKSTIKADGCLQKYGILGRYLIVDGRNV
jgi:hypothetical protein